MKKINNPYVQGALAVIQIYLGLAILGILPGFEVKGGRPALPPNNPSTYVFAGIFMFLGLLKIFYLVKGKKSASEAPIELNELDLEQVKLLVAEDKRIDAIKLVRKKTGAGLAEAKNFVDGLGQAGFVDRSS